MRKDVLLNIKNEEYYSNFYKNLNAVIEEEEVNKNDLAILANLSHSYLYDLLKGQGNPSLEVMVRIANALKLPLIPLFLPPQKYNVYEISPEFLSINNNECYTNFCSNVNLIIKNKEISKYDLSVLSNVASSYFYELLKGNGNPSLEVMVRIANALKRPLAPFFLPIQIH